MKKDIIILAAGVGSRLRPLTESVPKCMVSVNGEAIIQRILKQIDAIDGIEKNIFIVAGCKSETLRTFVDSLDIKVNYIENKEYDRTNNMYSLNLALRVADLSTGLIIINADCFYEEEVVTKMLLCKGNFIAIDKSEFNEESMKVNVDSSGYVRAMSKGLPNEEGNYVSMDIYSFDSNFKRRLFDITNKVIRDGDLNSWTEVAIDILAKEEASICGCDFSNRKWMEIDDHDDLKKAERIFAKVGAAS